MGCDIHVYAEARWRGDGEWLHIEGVEPFGPRNYSVFGFLADVRNYSAITPLSAPRGLPDDASDFVRREYEDWGDDAHDASWLSVEELAKVDYRQPVEDRNCTVQLGPGLWSGAGTCEPGQGQVMQLSAFLGEEFFADLERLKNTGAERIVFWFDN